MTQPAIVVEGLSKAYRIGHKEEVPDSLVGAIQGIVRSPWKNFQRLRRLNTFGTNGHNADDMIWALKDVSFEVAEGEVVGIIGRNGAGKSTLLKILSRITEPTSGRALIHGRVSSLLEVGTGFHPELTGRENIYMNGTILGMTKREIDRKFDEIVDFSGVEKFLDTPIKRYSSGMQVRLAFSVAAHLEPEILIVDEVLAVGDAEFQKKCIGKMHDVAIGGRTVLFVSHNMAAVRNLCQMAIILRHGKVNYWGDCVNGVRQYLAGLNGDPTTATPEEAGKPHILKQLVLRTKSGEETQYVFSGDPLILDLFVDARRLPRLVNFQINFTSSCGSPLFSVATHLSKSGPITLSESGRVQCHLDELPLKEGEYVVSLVIGAPYTRPFEVIDPVARFEVIANDYYGNGRLPENVSAHVLMRSQWKTITELGRQNVQG